MKTVVLALFVLVSAVGARAQGMINFANVNPGAGLNAPDFYLDGTKVSGNVMTAELLAGTTPTNLSIAATTGFLTGAGAGYFLGGTVTLSFIVPGEPVYVQVRLWETSYGSFAAAQADAAMWGQSAVFSVVTGGSGTPASVPAPLIGLTSIQLWNNPPQPIPILSVIRTGNGELLLSFATHYNQNYLVEQSLNLGTTNWTAFAYLVGSGEAAAIPFLPTNGCTFFRVRSL